MTLPYFATPRRLRQVQRGRELLVAHALGCHIFNGVECLRGAHHSGMQDACWNN